MRRTISQAMIACVLSSSGNLLVLADTGRSKHGGNNGKEQHYKYVIVGFGVSGQEAARVLAERYRNRLNLAVIEPFAVDVNRKAITLPYRIINSSIVDMDVKKKHLKLSNAMTISYEKCLLATGSLANLIDASAFIAADCNLAHLYDINNIFDRERLIDMAAKGQHITIAGASDWSSIHFAGQLAEAAAKENYSGSVTIITPSPNLLYSTLPKYLSQAIMRSLSSYGANIIPYSQIKYIANSFQPSANSNLFIYTGTTYDSIKTNSIDTDALAFNPYIGIPKLSHHYQRHQHQQLQMKDSLKKYQDWIEILRSVGLEIERDGMGIVANRSGEAVRDIFVGGDIGCVYAPYAGRGVYAGHIHARASGRQAAYHMLGEGEFHDDLPTYHLSSRELGVNLLLLGQCITTLETHGYWWKRRATNLDFIASDDAILRESKSPPLGIVFYVDNHDIIRGVLLSGSFDASEESIFKKSRQIRPLLDRSMDPIIAQSVDSSGSGAGRLGGNSSSSSSSTTRLMKLQYLSSLADQYLRDLLLSDDICQQASIHHHGFSIDSSSSSSGLTMPASQYKGTKAVLSSSLNQFNEPSSSSKSISLSPHPQRENIFFNAPVNVSRADRMTASFAKGIQDSMNMSP
jgi:hypothetical protein